MPPDHDVERDVFKRMENHDQSMALFDMMRFIRNELAAIRRELIDFQNNVFDYRHKREQTEGKQDQNTTDKIEAILNKRFDFFVYFRDKIFPPIATMIVIALLYLVFKSP